MPLDHFLPDLFVRNMTEHIPALFCVVQVLELLLEL